MMEMSDYGSQFGLAMPSVEILGIQNGEVFDPGDSVSVEVVALGPDNLAGTEDDGRIKEIRVLLNGEEIGLFSKYSGMKENLNRGFLSYNFKIPEGTKGGEYRLGGDCGRVVEIYLVPVTKNSSG